MFYKRSDRKGFGFHCRFRNHNIASFRQTRSLTYRYEDFSKDRLARNTQHQELFDERATALYSC